MKKLITILIISIFALQSRAQIDQRIDEWRSFLPYNDGRWVTQSPDRVYYSTGISLISVDKNDTDNIQFLDKVNGLSNVGIEQVTYDPFTEQLIVVYTDSDIDIVDGENVFNISDIKENQVLTGDRSVNDILPFQENIIYFGTAFGIVELNLERLEFTNTIFTNIAINELASNGTVIYAATDDGVFTIDIATAQNASDFSSWSLLGPEQGLPDVYEALYIESFDDRLFIVLDEDEIWVEGESGFSPMDLGEFSDLDIQFLNMGAERLMMGMRNGDQGRVVFVDTDLSLTSGPTDCTNRLLFAVEDETGRIWYADEFSRLRWSGQENGSCTMRITNSPKAEVSLDIDVKGDVVYVATGGVRENFTPLFNRDGFYILDNGTWNIFDENSLQLIAGLDFLNLFQIETHPSPIDNRIYVASYFEGLLEYDTETGEGTIYKENNSPILNTEGDPSRERISGLAFDQNEVLWINNFGAETPLIAMTPEGVWHAFDPAGDNQLAKVVVDDNGFTWSVLVGAGGGVVVHDSNQTPEDPTDDRSIVINSSNSAIETGTINTIGVDLDGEVWVGTNQGPVIFNSSSNLFEGEQLGSVRTVLQDSILAILLETEDILAIEFDGANRKWFGTRNGIFVQSPDGEIQEMRFNVDNSPLFDNQINALKYDDNTGIMYISTNQGLQSFRTQTLGATNRHSNTVFAYPNPVRPEYQGDIQIRGLARDANVKITDLNGKLVFETTALGGQAIWDGRDYTGRRAETGVYLVFSTGEVSFDTPDAFVTKIMIVN